MITPELLEALKQLQDSRSANRGPADVGAGGRDPSYSLSERNLAVLKRIQESQQQAQQPLPQQPGVESIGDVSPHDPRLSPAASAPAAASVHATAMPAVPVPAAQAPKSGMSVHNKNVMTTNSGHEHTGMKKDYDPQQLLGIMNVLNSSREIQDQKSGIDRQDAMAEAYKHAPMGMVDWGPALRLSDSWFKTKLAEGYAPPETLQQRMEKVMAHQNKLQDDRRDLTKSVMGLAAQSESGRSTDKLSEAVRLLREQQAGAQDPTMKGAGAKPIYPQYERIWSSFKDDKVAGKYITALNALPAAKVLLAQGTAPAFEMLKRQLLQMGGDTRPSDKDVGAFGGNRTLLNKAQQAWDWAFNQNGRISDISSEELAAILDGFGQVAGSRMMEMAPRYIDGVRPAYPDVNPQDALQFIQTKLTMPQAELKKTAETTPHLAQPGAPVAPKVLDRNRLEELRQKAAQQ